MSTLETLVAAHVADTDARDEILRTAREDTPHARYLRSEKGRASRQKSNAKYKAKMQEALKTVEIVDNTREHVMHVAANGAYPALLSDLWQMYAASEFRQPRVTRKHYAATLAALNIPALKGQKWGDRKLVGAHDLRKLEGAVVLEPPPLQPPHPLEPPKRKLRVARVERDDNEAPDDEKHA